MFLCGKHNRKTTATSINTNQRELIMLNMFFFFPVLGQAISIINLILLCEVPLF